MATTKGNWNTIYDQWITTDAAAATGFTHTFVKSRASAGACSDGDVIYQITAIGYNDNATPAQKTVANMKFKIADVTDTNEDGEISFEVMAAGSAAAEVFKISSTGISVTGTLSFSGDFTVNTDKFIITASTGDIASWNKQADATGVEYSFKKSRAAGAACSDNDVCMDLLSIGYNDNATPAAKTVARIQGIITDVSDTTEDGAIVFQTMVNGAAAAEKLRIASVITASAGITLGDGTGDYDLKLFGSAAGNYLLWDRSGNDLIMTGESLDIKQATTGKTIRINSQTYTDTTNEVIGFQCKPRWGILGTQDLTAAQFSPGANDTFGGTNIYSVVSDVVLKGTSGNFSGSIYGFKSQITDENAAGRTVSGTVACYYAWQQLAAHTFTGGVYVLAVGTNGGATNWSGLMKLPDNGGSIADLASAVGSVNGAIKVLIGSTTAYIPTYDGYTPA